MFDVLELFTGISGEVCQGHQGRLTYFVRFGGCNLQCKWCDTAYSQKSKGHSVPFDALVKNIRKCNPEHTLLTGGEPLLQKEIYLLINELLQFTCVTVETNGSIPFGFEEVIPYWRHRLSVIYDYKMPSSGMFNEMLYSIDMTWKLSQNDFIKMAVADNNDLDCALALLCQNMAWVNRVWTPVISPVIVDGKCLIDAEHLVQSLWDRGLHDVIVSVQVHKILNVK